MIIYLNKKEKNKIMSVNAINKLAFPKNYVCSRNCINKNLKENYNDHSKCRKKSILAQREAEYDKNLKSIKYKPKDDLICNRENIKANFIRKSFRDRSRSVKKTLIKPEENKSTPPMTGYTLEATIEKKEDGLNIETIKVDETILDEFENMVESNDINIMPEEEIVQIEVQPETRINYSLVPMISAKLNYFQDYINKINLGFFTFNYENIKINKEFSAKFSASEYRRVMTTLIEHEYGRNIIKNLALEEEQTNKFLERHEITERMRAKMIDWMIEVLSSYYCDENTFFLSINIMDRYFKYTTEILKPDDLHLIGIACMFIASKFYDIFPIKLKMMAEKVSHGKFSAEQIKSAEEKIVKCLNYMVYKSTIYEFINLYIEEIFFFIENNFHIYDDSLSNYVMNIYKLSNVKLDFLYYEKNKLTKNYTIKMISLLRKILLYISKMICYDYSLIGIKPSLLAASAVLVSIKICEEINNESYINTYIMNKLLETSGYIELEIIAISQKVLHNAQNYDMLFNGLDNLKRRHFDFTIDNIDVK
jgi:hypothetical protein